VAESSTESRNPWFVRIVVGLMALAFAGGSILLIVSSSFQNAPPAAVNPSAPTAASTPASQKAELESRAKGYEGVLQREPNNKTALEELLKIRLGLGDVKGAIEPLEKLAKLNPQETQYSILLAQAKQENKDFEGAAQTYRELLAAKPGEILALQGLVGLLIEQKRPEAALSLLQDTLKSASQVNQAQPGTIDVASVQILLASVYASGKRYDEAIATYEEAAKIAKQDFRPFYGKAVVLKEQGKTEEANALFTKAAELAPAKYKDQIKQAAGIAPAPGTVAPGTVAPGTAAPETAPAVPKAPAAGTGEGAPMESAPASPAPAGK
jgi:tetratricopeptide (TPR) repeat protein